MAESVIQLSSLRGEKLTSVRFAADFVEFDFSGQVIRALAGAELHARGFTISSPEDGSRDAFCTLIGDTVTEVDLTSEPTFNLAFSSGTRLSIPLHEAYRTGVEAMQFIKHGKLVVTW